MRGLNSYSFRPVVAVASLIYYSYAQRGAAVGRDSHRIRAGCNTRQTIRTTKADSDATCKYTARVWLDTIAWGDSWSR